MLFPTQKFAPMMIALEPFNAVCNYVAGHAWVGDSFPEGDGHPVLVYPGLGVSGAATTELRTRLQRLGYRVYDWELGFGTWPCSSLDAWLEPMAMQLQEIRKAHAAEVSLIGWSFGGIYARELAKRCPGDVRQVITMGTPLTGSAVTNAVARISPPAGTQAFTEEMAQRFEEAPGVPCASIFSKSDGFVDWKQCVDPQLSDDRNIEVSGVSHFGLVHHPEVLRAIAMLLAQPHAMASA